MDGFSKTMAVAVAAVMVLAVAIPIIYVAEQDGSRQVTYHSLREASTVEGDSVIDCRFERDGFVFIGWNTERDGSGTDYLPGDSLEGARGVWDLYAQWAPSVESVMYSSGAGDIVDGLYIVYADGGSVPLDHGVRLDGGAHLEVRCDGLTFSLDDGVFVSGDTVLDVDIFASVTDVVPYIDPDTGYACYSFTPGGGVAFTVHLTETA